MANKSYLCLIFLQNFLVLTTTWSYFYSRDINDYIDVNRTNPRILPENFCQEDSLLTIIVTSSPSHSKARKAIRDTWASRRNISNSKVFVYFVLGETRNRVMLQNDINFESNQYGDIIQEEHFIDCYDNLTIKSVVMLKLFNHYCNNSSKYLFKTDDDMYVNLDNIVEMLENRNQTNNLLIGHLICKGKVFRNFLNKWYCPKYMYSSDFYPNFLSGTGYIMSADVANKLYKTAIFTKIFHIEDVFITGIVAKKAKITPQNDLRFTYQKFSFDPCYFQELSTIHYCTPLAIRTIYIVLNLLNTTKICTGQKRLNFEDNQLITNGTLQTTNYYKPSNC